jgi:ABC-type Fe3+/spermidine/putrescine transport system ATPase subunit
MTKVSLDHISADYGATRVLKDFSLEIANGEFIALLGPSGCGKTTILKIIAGLLAPGSGDLCFDGRSVADIPAEKRGAVMVFQKPLLFPYLTVAENIAFGLKMRSESGTEIKRRVAAALDLVQLRGYESRRPRELSGGQEQRVTLARALVTEPRVLLLDEPFSALDENLRGEMRTLVRDLQQRLRITTVFVTHDQHEAASLADRIALVLGGRLEQCGAPRDFYTAPQTAAAARFFGWKLIPGERRGRVFVTPLGDFTIDPEYDGERGWMAFRPESVRLQPDHESGAGPNFIEGSIRSVLDLGTRIRYRLTLANGEDLEIKGSEMTDSAVHTPGSMIKLYLPSTGLRFLA